MNMNTEHENTMTAGPSPPPKTTYRVRCPKCGAGPDHITKQWRETRYLYGLHVVLDGDGVPLIHGSDVECDGWSRDVFICGRCGKKSHSERVFIDVALEEVDA